jgi:hypothetical protein
MIHGFPELVIGGVLIAPFVSYALVPLALFFCSGLRCRSSILKQVSAIRRWHICAST